MLDRTILNYGGLLVAALTALLLPNPTSCVSVTNLCMMEQKKLLNISTNKAIKRQEDQIMHTINTICRSYTDYINCFVNNLPNSDDIGDRFSRLMFDGDSMAIAYRGFCKLDYKSLYRIRFCLVTTSELRACYFRYESGVEKVLQLQDQGQFETDDLQALACNVSVGRYKCETEKYGKCNIKAREIMQDFIFASLPNKCRERTGVASRYLSAFDDNNKRKKSSPRERTGTSPHERQKPSSRERQKPSSNERQKPSARGRQKPSSRGRQKPSSHERQKPSSRGRQNLSSRQRHRNPSSTVASTAAARVNNAVSPYHKLVPPGDHHDKASSQDNKASHHNHDDNKDNDALSSNDNDDNNIEDTDHVVRTLSSSSHGYQTSGNSPLSISRKGSFLCLVFTSILYYII